MTTALHAAFRSQLARRLDIATARVVSASTSSLEEFLTTAVPSVLDAQRAVVTATDAYLSLEAGLATGTSTATWGLDPNRLVGRIARRGSTLEDVYARTLLANGGGGTAKRLAREVATDINLARRNATWAHTSSDPRIAGYRRVLGTGGTKGVCALCVVAATRVYRSEDLQPIHSHCTCSSEPVYVDGPAPEVTREFLDDIYARAGTTEYGGLRRIHVSDDDLPPGVARTQLPGAVDVIDTPELGPTLVAV